MVKGIRKSHQPPTKKPTPSDKSNQTAGAARGCAYALQTAVVLGNLIECSSKKLKKLHHSHLVNQMEYVISQGAQKFPDAESLQKYLEGMKVALDTKTFPEVGNWLDRHTSEVAETIKSGAEPYSQFTKRKEAMKEFVTALLNANHSGGGKLTYDQIEKMLTDTKHVRDLDYNLLYESISEADPKLQAALISVGHRLCFDSGIKELEDSNSFAGNDYRMTRYTMSLFGDMDTKSYTYLKFSKELVNTGFKTTQTHLKTESNSLSMLVKKEHFQSKQYLRELEKVQKVIEQLMTDHKNP